MEPSHSILFRSIIAAVEDNILSVLLGILFVCIALTWIIARWTLNVDKGIKQADDSSTWLKKIHDLIDNYLKNPVKFSGSPITLTDRGLKIVETLTPNDFIETFAQEHLSSTKDKGSYQIQEIAFRFAVETMLNRIRNDFPQRVKDIEDCAFQHGVRVDQVMDALGVVLRDRILALHNQPVS
ncbi:MAG: hypothetical protein F4201_11330 [Nitrospira sp. SB0677_bin_15]|nr:hypothetical protein [Nitrospira sp. SB0667_bin_9]MYD30093.1 hypothetical protein [Nitrospira sp. SB0661_bin_20]MYG41377.1 hypothetical protein [Nitrospira sp. SB0677_bin_15]MYH02733.1 hypothetical protein [Nitrospira sp. SB0675_bin_23]MYJ22181.1 hypothetical protein [Nitrospira sp. SB0673_bin_12]